LPVKFGIHISLASMRIDVTYREQVAIERRFAR
jgi:hypothetical protein